MSTFDKVITSLCVAIFVPGAIACVYLMFVILPVQLHTASTCLRQGYPQAQVTIGLERYCVTMEGATVKVEKQ